MKTVILTRWASGLKATHGRLSVGEESWLTVERPYTDMAHPCIPVGTYVLKWDFYHKGGYAVYEVTGIPNRSRILIHGANRASDLEGCIAPGESLEIFGGEIGVTSSRASLAAFHKAMGNGSGPPDKDAELVIREVF